MEHHIHLLRVEATATKWARPAMPATVYHWHLRGLPTLATAKPPTTHIRVVAAPMVGAATIPPEPDTSTTTGCGNGLGPTPENSAVDVAIANPVGSGPGPAVAAEAGAEIGRKIGAARRHGTNETGRDHPPDDGAKGTATMMLAVSSID